APRRGPLRDAGRRARRAALHRHARPGLPQALHRARAPPRARAAAGLPRRRHRRARARHRRRPRRCDPALRRPAEASHPARGRRDGVGEGRAHGASPGGGAMTFLWPEFLWLLALVPLLVAAYFLILRRKARTALRYASLTMVREAMGSGARFRRHVPPLLFLLALVVMIVAVPRPAAVGRVPSQPEIIILGLDVSGSMRAKDVEPDRMTAAQNAAKTFINEQPRSTRIGVVAFAGTASLVQPPTNSREDLHAAIDRLQL